MPLLPALGLTSLARAGASGWLVLAATHKPDWFPSGANPKKPFNWLTTVFSFTPPSIGLPEFALWAAWNRSDASRDWWELTNSAYERNGSCPTPPQASPAGSRRF